MRRSPGRISHAEHEEATARVCERATRTPEPSLRPCVSGIGQGLLEVEVLRLEKAFGKDFQDGRNAPFIERPMSQGFLPSSAQRWRSPAAGHVSRGRRVQRMLDRGSNVMAPYTQNWPRRPCFLFPCTWPFVDTDRADACDRRRCL